MEVTKDTGKKKVIIWDVCFREPSGKSLRTDLKGPQYGIRR